MKEVIRENLLIELVDTQKVEGGILLETGNGEKSEGVVIDIGGKVEEVKVGDKVTWLTRATFDKFNENEKEYVIVNEGNIIWREGK